LVQTRGLLRSDRHHDPARVLALTDGVIAIVITLLVLEIHVPELPEGPGLNERLIEELRLLGPFFVGFLLSFVVTAIAWAAHRSLFALIQRTDRTLVWLNILYLLPLSLLPFGAALISQYDREPVALRVYGLQLLLIALTRLIIWLYATNRPDLLYEPIDHHTKTVGVLIVGVPAALYLLAILIAGSAPAASFVIYVGSILLYFIAIFVDRLTAPPGSVEEDDFT
jgi:uncharacterized membrane protein